MNWDNDAPVPLIELLERWRHQNYAVEKTVEAIDAGVKRILVTTPTGGGKTLEIADLAQIVLRRNQGVMLFTNRRLLIEQMKQSFSNYGFDFGIRAANHVGDASQRFQLASLQTEHSRLIKRQVWENHPCGVFFVDEAHLNENKSSNRVYQSYLDEGAVKVGFTATPLGLGGGYDQLIVAGLVPELFDCGALVPAIHHGCTEPDLRNVKKYKVGEEITEDNERKAIMVPGIHGRVIDHYRRLNPQGLPSIGFAPGVGESVGFAKAFEEAGIPAAHIDGERIWVCGEEFPSTEERRRELLKLSRTGRIRIIWNRFVLREAIDMPWLRHGIFACVFGTLGPYLQAGGRLLRACPVVGKQSVTIQDHGGNWWRHGSLNNNRHWRLTDTSLSVAHEHVDSITGEGTDNNEPTVPEPFRCNNCDAILKLRVIRAADGLSAKCPQCGYVMDFRRRSRMVIQANGELVEMSGPVYQARRTERRPDTQAKWEKYYWMAKNSNMTFSQAAGLFCVDNGYFPPRTMALMPRTNWQWYLSVKKVPYKELRSKEEAHATQEAN